MANAGIKTAASGLNGALTFGGADVVTFDGTGITSGVPGKNKLINGRADVFQRSSVNMTTAYSYFVDRWIATTGTTASGTLQAGRSTGDANSKWAMYMAKTAGTYSGSLALIQIIESINCYELAGKTLSVSFRARVGSTYSGSATPSVALYSGTVEDQGSAGGIGSWTGFVSNTVTSVTTPNLTTTFQSYKYTTSAPVNAKELALSIYISCTATAGTTNDVIEITDVQLEIGSTATPFEQRPYGMELALCQRYYHKGNLRIQTYAAASNAFGYFIKYPVEMRVAATSVSYPTPSYTNASGIGTSTPASTDGHFVFATATSTALANVQSDYTATAEL